MDVTLNVKRYTPETKGDQPYFQEYAVKVPDDFTVLDTLIQVREEVDESLGMRCSCRAAICGSCAMRINGEAALGCRTKLVDATRKGPKVTVEPMGNQPVIKDLIVDMDEFWSKVRQVQPYLQPEGPEPEAEYLAPNDAMQHLVGVMGCIMCGACVSDCTSLEADANFIGPAALAKAYRFVHDPRDDHTQDRLTKLNQYSGIWDCTRCYYCVQVCPKGVAPMDRIVAMRADALDAGFKNTYGARHAEVFTESVRHSGLLNELNVAIKTPGLFNIAVQLKNLPVGVRAFLRNKLPPIFHRPIPNVENVRRIFDKVEGKR